MNSPEIRIHILLHSFYLINCSFLVNFFKITGRASGKIWFMQDAIDCPERTETFCRENLTRVGHEFVATVRLDHIC